MAKIQDIELLRQLRLKLLNNNIYFKVFKDVVFKDSTIKVKSGADLIVSGIGMRENSSSFTFMCVYKDRIDLDTSDNDDDEYEFGLIRISLYDLIERLKDKTIVAYYVGKQSPDEEIEALVKYA